ncbi:hypothetical protein P12x_005012 [Tundrisphaera lichenicola]|uniref:hypothetical protein n=1 Tax=Tundrisphaera lichenicola TaxID=2029860 RepID=UPI003EBF9A47
MLSSRTGLPRRPAGLSRSVLAGLAVLGLVASTGCQVEYAGMTLPSGKYFHDDVQYFAKGPEFPYANTQAATQRARMQAAGMATPPPPGTVVPPTMGGAALPGTGPGVAMPPAGAGLPRPNAASEMENAELGGASAPNPPAPGMVPGPGDGPGGFVPPPN